MDESALEILVAKDAIRELVLLYSRGCDRKDFDLLRTLYTEDATDSHDETFDGPAGPYVDFLERSLPHAPYTGHHVSNHLISVDVEQREGEGEVYALAWHVIPDAQGGWIEDFLCCRYVDRYKKGVDGQWRFAKRVVSYDMRSRQSHLPFREAGDPRSDPSYALSARLFAFGPRARSGDR